MSNYIESSLNRNERVIAKAKFSLLRAVPKLISCAIIIIIGIIFLASAKYGEDVKDVMVAIGAILLAISWIPFVVAVIKIKSNELAVTNRRVLGKKGVFSRQVVDLHLDKVDAATVTTTFAGRILNYSTVSISGSGDSSVHYFEGLKDAETFRNAVNEAIETYANEARMQQAREFASAMNMSGKF